MKECRLRVFEYEVLIRIFIPKRGIVNGRWKIVYN
jgi:hypothetical protein